MSTTLVEKEIKDGRYWFNRFYGGTRRGKCVQLTLDINKSYLQFSKAELTEFIKDAKKALKEL